MIIDADIWIDIIRGYQQAADFLIKEPESVKVCRITIMELVRGCHSNKDVTIVKSLLSKTNAVTVEIDQKISENAGQIFERFHLSHNIGLIDAVTAATALESEEKLATRNLKHYKFIPKLQLHLPYR